MFETIPLEPSRTGFGDDEVDEVDGLPALSVSARKTPQPVDPYSRGRAQTYRYFTLSLPTGKSSHCYPN